MDIRKVIAVIIIFSLGFAIGTKKISRPIQENKNTQQAFIAEVTDKIKANYWDNISDAQLKDMFKMATQQNGGEVNKETAAKIAQTVLASLNPQGRSGL